MDEIFALAVGKKANPATPLSIATYDGSNQATHPSVKYFPDGLFGKQFWMACTPYPNDNDSLENPCIYCSDDGVAWAPPIGLTNPIAPKPADGYNSDPHLVYNSAFGILECWYRQAVGADEIIVRQTTSDGVTWSAAQTLQTIPSPNLDKALSPVVLWDVEAGKYRIWVVYNDIDTRYLKYYESTNGTTWTFIRNIAIDDPVGYYYMWHCDILYTPEYGYEFVGCYQVNREFDLNNYLYYAQSTDNITYSAAVRILSNGDAGAFDDLELYRPSLMRKDGRIMLYYGAQKAPDTWHIGLIACSGFDYLAASAAKQREHWLYPVLGNDWVNYGDFFTEARFMKDASGIVHLEGLIKDGIVFFFNDIFFLPLGYRPAGCINFAVASNDEYGQLAVKPDGGVALSAGTNVWASLSGVSFVAEG